MQPFLAMITPVGGGRPVRPDNSLPGSGNRPDNSLPGEQPGIDNSLPPFPAFPIYIPIVPPSSGGEAPSHPIYIPVYPVYPDNTLPGSQPRPDNSLPGEQPEPSHPIYYPEIPGVPTHPIEIPEGTPPAETIEIIKEKIEFLMGNLPPDNSGPKPTPVRR